MAHAKGIKTNPQPKPISNGGKPSTTGKPSGGGRDNNPPKK